MYFGMLILKLYHDKNYSWQQSLAHLINKVPDNHKILGSTLHARRGLIIGSQYILWVNDVYNKIEKYLKTNDVDDEDNIVDDEDNIVDDEDNNVDESNASFIVPQLIL